MNNKTISTLISIVALSAVTGTAWAVGTLADTQIDNKATISYQVSGTSQPVIESSLGGNSTAGVGNGGNTSFKVDRKIDLTVTSNAGITVAPGATSQAITFDVTNNGNSEEFFKLTESQAGGDNFNTNTCVVTTSTGAGIGVFDAGNKTVQLEADKTTTVTVSCTVPGTATDGQTSVLDLKATAVTSTTGGTTYTESAADNANPLTVDTVLADGSGSDTDTGAETVAADITAANGNRNASHSVTNTFTVGTAILKVTKASVVYSDPTNSTTDPKRIPGAIIKYTITVENTGSTSATALSVADYIPTNMTYSTTPAACAATGGGACALDPVLVIGLGAAANGIKATAITVAAAGTETVVFYATVN